MPLLVVVEVVEEGAALAESSVVPRAQRNCDRFARKDCWFWSEVEEAAAGGMVAVGGLS